MGYDGAIFFFANDSSNFFFQRQSDEKECQIESELYLCKQARKMKPSHQILDQNFIAEKKGNKKAVYRNQVKKLKLPTAMTSRNKRKKKIRIKRQQISRYRKKRGRRIKKRGSVGEQRRKMMKSVKKKFFFFTCHLYKRWKGRERESRHAHSRDLEDRIYRTRRRRPYIFYACLYIAYTFF